MNEKLQISLCICIGNQLKRFFRGNAYEYFIINTKKICDNQISSVAETSYFVKDPWENDSYIMLNKCMFDKMFVKLDGVEDKTNEFFNSFEVILPEDNSQIVVEDKEVSNDNSFIESNKYR